MQNRYLFSFCLLALLLFSCKGKNDRKHEIENYLTNGREKYWTIMEGRNIKRNQGRVYKSDGIYVDYYVKDFKEIGIRLLSESHEYPKWEIKGDDTLCISGFLNQKVEYINDDILILKSNDIVIWYKSEDQKTKPVPDTTKYLYPSL